MGVSELAIHNAAIYGAFFEQLEGTIGDSWVPQLTTFIRTDQETVKHRWLRRGPVMTEWQGQRSLSRLDADSYDLSNVVFSSGLEVTTDELRRDQSGQIIIRARELADDAALHPENRLSTVIQAGNATACYDGQFFFDTDHPYTDTAGAAATQSNDITSAAVAPTAPTHTEFANAIIAGLRTIIGLKNERGLPRNQNLKQFVVMVPTSLMDAALGAVTIQFVANGVTNPLTAMQNGGFAISVIPNPYLAWTDEFMIAATGGIMKPFLFQEELDTQLGSLTEGSEQEIMNRRHVYTAERIYEIGYGRYEGACLVTFT